MSAVTIFLLGTVALTNVALVGYLLADRNKSVKPPDERKPETVPKSPPEESPPIVKPTDTSRVGQSKFNVDEFLKKFEQLEQGVIRMNKTLDRLEEDVRFRDVEFVNEEDKPSDEEIAKDEATVNTEKADETAEAIPQVPVENLDKVFEDARIEEFDGDTVSSPSASGFTTEEIEDSVAVVNNPNSSPEDKVKAGRVLISMSDTNFSDKVLSDEKIQNDLLECYRLSLRSEIEDKESRKQKTESPSPVSQKAVPTVPLQQIPPKKKGFHISKNFDDFNPEDLIRK